MIAPTALVNEVIRDHPATIAVFDGTDPPSLLAALTEAVRRAR